MSQNDPRSVSVILAEQSDRLRKAATPAPSSELASTIAKRLVRRRRQRRVWASCGGIAVVVMASWLLQGAPTIGQHAKETPAPHHASAYPGARTNQSDLAVDSDANQAVIVHTELEQLVDWVSDQAGAKAQVITVEDMAGQLHQAIYVPERYVPVAYENLSPFERQAVGKVLDEPNYF